MRRPHQTTPPRAANAWRLRQIIKKHRLCAPFVDGVVDSEDLPLNVSRETVQNNRLMGQLGKTIKGRVLRELKKLAESEPERYDQFIAEFGPLLKEGIATDPTARDEVLPLWHPHHGRLMRSSAAWPKGRTRFASAGARTRHPPATATSPSGRRPTDQGGRGGPGPWARGGDAAPLPADGPRVRGAGAHPGTEPQSPAHCQLVGADHGAAPHCRPSSTPGALGERGCTHQHPAPEGG
ncbi:MAG: hypothetical protein IPH95_02805 [Candidatus Promineofilum sp.]|nr:hypothetical protein [Promineifilum sp.]